MPRWFQILGYRRWTWDVYKCNDLLAHRFRRRVQEASEETITTAKIWIWRELHTCLTRHLLLVFQYWSIAVDGAFLAKIVGQGRTLPQVHSSALHQLWWIRASKNVDLRPSNILPLPSYAFLSAERSKASLANSNRRYSGQNSFEASDYSMKFPF